MTKGIFSFILGVSAGVALGLLFAPKAGEETREDIKETMDNIKYKVDDLYHRGVIKTSELYEKGKEKTTDFLDKRKKKSEEANA
ncbi:YtxH domain-containing protein [Brachyspira pilosicoli]|uniref:YtxH domain-containing protein n=1 Tax=Brachyspira pilosicoli TaxID=52584 RepID=UPI002431E0B8|nr:YtxH domain-containing protein [Brachyspira pilosicoli]